MTDAASKVLVVHVQLKPSSAAISTCLPHAKGSVTITTGDSGGGVEPADGDHVFLRCARLDAGKPVIAEEHLIISGRRTSGGCADSAVRSIGVYWRS